MTEWTVVSIIVVLVGLVATVIGATWKLCKTLMEISNTLNVVKEGHDILDRGNSVSHDRMWGKLEEHTDTIVDHETRITVIEKQGTRL